MPHGWRNVHLLWNFLEGKWMLSYSVSQTKWCITTEAENSATGSAFVLAMEMVACE
jgi:hypothetical protein